MQTVYNMSKILESFQKLVNSLFVLFYLTIDLLQSKNFQTGLFCWHSYLVACLEPSQISTMELFCKNSKRRHTEKVGPVTQGPKVGP